MVQFLNPEGEFGVPKGLEVYKTYLDALSEADFLKFYRDMARMRRFDVWPGTSMMRKSIGECTTTSAGKST
jgi:pyruvate dehydrogenase E1 component alpha subunit